MHTTLTLALRGSCSCSCSMRRRTSALALAGLLALATGCTDADDPDISTGEDPATEELAFEERAAAAGIDFTMEFLPLEQGENFKVNLYDHGAGVAVADVDGDGHDDILLLNQLGANALFRNKGDGTFEDITARAGPVAMADRICVAPVFGDYDSDGDQDLYITSTRGGNALFRNAGDGTFEDVTRAAGVQFLGHSQGATFFDYDGDSDLDLFVTNTAEWTTSTFNEAANYFRGKEILWELVKSEPESNVMFRNEGDGTFANVTEELGLHGTAWGGDFVVFDYDLDGDPDLFVTNMFGRSVLYRNDEGRHFVDVTNDVLGVTSWGSIGARALDFDSDGLLDFALADMHSDMWMASDFSAEMIVPWKKYRYSIGRMADLKPGALKREKRFADEMKIDYGHVLFGNTLFRNKGDGTFEEISKSAKFETFWPWGVAVGDFDCDGHEDLFLPSGMGYPFFYWPNALLRNRGDGTFEDRSMRAGVVPELGERDLPDRIGGVRAARSSRCAGVGDFDGDGRLDLIANNFNDTPSLYINRSTPQHFVGLRLRGTKSNRDAIGALVTIEAGGRRFVRQVQAAGGYLSQSTLTVHFGLGQIDTLDRCEIRWPSGEVTSHDDIEVDQYMLVSESGQAKRWER
jgi:hypothetical protein